MILSLIAAVAANGAIGKDNAIPWYLPCDLRYFKSITTGKALIMGRKTFESLRETLHHRRHIVITSGSGYDISHPGIETAASLGEAIIKASCEDEAFIIGGGRVYREALPLCDRLYITEIYSYFDADTYFPDINYSMYELVSQSKIFNENGITYRFKHYRRL